jgi:hypothetical protein
MTRGIWQVQPLQATIIEILQEKGSMTTDALFEALKAFHAMFGFADLRKTLMKMELTGLVFVSSLPKDRQLVRLKKRNL